MEEELMKSMRFRQADNTNANVSARPQQTIAEAMAPAAARSAIFASYTNDAKRMSFDGNMPQYAASSPLGLASGLVGGVPNFNRDRRDSLKNMVHLQDFGTD